MRLSLTKRSSNKKTGPIPVSTSSSDTCPSSCPWQDNGCYADGGPLKIHWRKLDNEERGISFGEFLKEIAKLPQGTLWRHNQAGDLHHTNGRIHLTFIKALVKANKDKRGFTYTHHLIENNNKTSKENRNAIAYANSSGFTINLSANSIEHADRLVKLNIAPITTVVPENQTTGFRTPDGNKVVICPAAIRDDITCQTCKLCAISTRKSI